MTSAVNGRRVLVIGAGVIGAGVALELARSGYAVTVIDRAAMPGAGSTSASSAIVRFHYRHLDEVLVAWESAERWRRWPDYLRSLDPVGMATFHQTGLLLLPGELVRVQEALRHMATLGILVDELDPAQVIQRFPALDPSRFGPPALPSDERFWSAGAAGQPAYWMPECGFVDDPQLAAHNLAHAASVEGAEFRFNADVVAVTRTKDRVTGVELRGGELIESDIIVNVAGPWSGQLNALAGVLGDAATTKPLQQEVISLPAPPGMTLDTGVCVADGDLGAYFRPHPGDTLVVGGMEADCDPLDWLTDPGQARQDVSQRTFEVASLRVGRRLPGAALPGRPRGVVGVYDVTQDWIPIYDRTSLPGFYVAIGTSGHGFKQAPFVGALMTALITACEAGHPHDEVPLGVLAPASGRTVDLGHFSRLRQVVPQAAMG